jgi:hypothetical protein
MHRRLFPILLHLLTCSVMGQDRQALVLAVDAECARIGSQCAAQGLVKRDLPELRSTEGGEAEACIDASGIHYLRVTWYGETNHSEIEYFLRNDTLLFALDHRFVYNRPIYWDSARAKANNDTVVFDPALTVQEQDRYYFKDGILVLWLDHEGAQQDLTLGTNTLIGAHLIAHAALAGSWFRP